jgi:hypothetical protein
MTYVVTENCIRCTPQSIGTARLGFLSPRYSIEASQSGGHSCDHYIAAFSSISILYGVFRILQRLSSMSASQK